MGDGPPWRQNAAGGPRPASWRVLWQSREVIGYLALRDLKLRYRQAVLGVVWVLVQPVASVVVFTFVFRRLAGVESQGVPYPLFALTGMVTWTYFATTAGRASEVLVGSPNLVTKVAFPRIAMPAASLLPPVLDLAVSLVLVAVLVAHYRAWPGINVIAAPVWIAALAATTFGTALWLSALNVRYRDVHHAVGPLLQLCLFASPVAYPSTLLPGWAGLLYALNPMVGIIGLGRWTLLGAPWPGWPLLVSLTVAALVLVSGLAYFRRAEPSFADVL